MSLHDLTGQRFGRLTVKYREDKIQKNGRKRTAWVCQCDCGNSVCVISDNLISGATCSCGCLRSDMLSEIKSTHKQTDTHLYGVWCAMKSRCNTQSSTYYCYYGGRGIKVCDEWMKSFETFYDWAMESGYKQGLTIDRIDADGNYCPENCRWITGVAQANNRRSNRNFTYNGETHNLTEWAKIYGINPKTLFNRIYAGWDFEKAITTKVKS